MSYAVRLLSGTDTLTIPGDARTYRVGEVIKNLPDETRVSLQRSGVRFEAVDEGEPPPAPPDDSATKLPPDQVAVNKQIAEARAKSAPATQRKVVETSQL